MDLEVGEDGSSSNWHCDIVLSCAHDGLTALMESVSVLQELEAIKARVREMEEEAEKLKELQNEVEKQMNLSPPPGASSFFHLPRQTPSFPPHLSTFAFSSRSAVTLSSEGKAP